MATEPPTYHAYLLRLWQVNTEKTGATIWRASLEDPHTGTRLGFATLEHLFAYIMELTEGIEQPSPPSSLPSE